MITPLLGRILKVGPPVRDLFASAVGCFVIMRGFRLLATGEARSETGSPLGVDGTSRKRGAEVGAALFLLVFVASETLLTIHAFRL
jgi:hypothetical protein